MIKIYLISYAKGKRFKKHQKRLNKSAQKYKFINIISYDEDNLKRTKFYNKYQNILTQEVGAGYWLWKPFFIYKTLKQIDEGDFLIYADAGSVFVNSPLPLLKIAQKENILLFTNNEPNIKWNKFSCLLGMNCTDSKYINRDAKQVSAGFQIYINNEKTRAFVKEWLCYCCKPGLIDNNLLFNPYSLSFFAFKEHRHDQSILTNLTIKYDLPLYRDPSQGGNNLKPLELREKGEWLPHPYIYTEDKEQTKKSKYLTIINHLRNTGKLKLILIKLHAKLPRWLKIIIKRK